ncbi:MAG: NAD-binding protein, partial [Spirochaetia bacterium]|nr:NAD-binding protein [Spirochaetia bacterium]
FAGKVVKDLHKVLEARVLVALIYQDGQYTIPKGDTQIQEGDLLYLMGTEEALSKVLSQGGIERINLNKMIIVGGNDISAYVCQHFYDKGEISVHKRHFWNIFQKPLGKKNIAIIDRDYKRCKELAARFPEALILNEDISDENVLEDEGLTDGDLIMAATENQELNIVSAVYAKSLGVKKALALVKKTSYLNVATNLGIDVPISLNYSTLQGILRFMRRRGLKNSYSIPESDIEVIQLQIPETSMAAGLLVKEIKFPPQTLILSVRSDDKDILPNGNYEFKKGDNIILLVKKDNIDRVQTIFK